MGNVIAAIEYNPGNNYYYEYAGICGYSNTSTIIECYSTGRIKGIQSIGGIVGEANNSSIIKNSIAINAHISKGIDNARIVGAPTSVTMASNYAWEHMYLADSLVQYGNVNNNNGQSIPFIQLTSNWFYTQNSFWSDTIWDFDSTWVINSAISPYPILKEINIAAQKVKHAQALIWEQEIATPVGDTLTLTAKGGRSGATINYSSFEPGVANINGNLMTVTNHGASRIMAYVAGNEFFATDSIIKPIVNFTTAGTIDEPHLIYNLSELDAVRCNLNAHYKLVADIDMEPIFNWEPIGNEINGFTGSFDGNNHSLSNLMINREQNNLVGLFGVIGYYSSGELKGRTNTNFNWKSVSRQVKNLNIFNANVSGNGYVGILSGLISDTFLVDNIKITGNVKGYYYCVGGLAGEICLGEITNSSCQGNIFGFDEVGGLAGAAYNSFINNCYFTGHVFASNYEAGGIIGYGSDNSINKCFTFGNIISSRETGGIAGSGYNLNINNCYSGADITTFGYNSAGIIGHRSGGQVSNCYATGFVNVAKDNYCNYSGGIAGQSPNNNNLKNNLAINAKITGNNYLGRVLGTQASNLNNNYAWNNIYINDIKITNNFGNHYNGMDLAIELSKTQSFYTDSVNWNTSPWNFDSVWTMNAAISPYPVLQGIEASLQKHKHTQVMTDAWTQLLPQHATVLDVIMLNAPSEGPSQMIAYASSDTNIAVIRGDTLFAKAVGSVTISAYYPETEFYRESNAVTRIVTITYKANQSINWAQSLFATYGDNPISLTATATSGLNVTYISNNENVAVVSGNQLIIVGAGAANITASQTGNANFQAAAEIVKNIMVLQKSLAISNFWADDKSYDGTTAVANAGFIDYRVAGDSLTFTFDAQFVSATVGTDKQVNISNVTISGGTDINNYVLSNNSGLAYADITTKALTISGSFTVFDKTNDGTTIANINQNSLSLAGVITGEVVNLHPVAAFTSPLVGNNITVVLTDASTLGGADSANYHISLIGAPSATASILPATTYTVTFSVATNGTPIAGGVININSQFITTDANGQAGIQLPNGPYTYNVAATNYISVGGLVTVNSSNQNVDVNMIPVGIMQIDASEVAIYPNPATDAIYVKTDINTGLELTILDLNGNMVKMLKSENASTSFNVNDLNTGYYLLKIKSKDAERVYKIFKN